ncbi:MAG: sigma-54 interaction domain-containing protein [Phycisphaerae bacterium]
MDASNPLTQPFGNALLETIPCAVFLLDTAQRILYVNPFAEKLTGYPAEKLVGQSCQTVSMMFQDQADPEVLKAMCPLGSEETLWDQQCQIRRADGSMLPVVRKAQPVKDAGGQTMGAIQILVDVSSIVSARSEIESLRQQVESAEGFGELIGSAPRMQKLYEAIELVSATDASVVISGPTGTGKELVARTIHKRSDRAEEIFLAVNCGALPDTLLEAELFGHVKGAFTGAASDRPGRFEQAHGGTLLLDEIGEMPLAAQVKLLRALQEGEITRVGESRPRQVDVRIIAATNRDLLMEVEAGRFRQDLYYRLNVVSLEVPPLTERREDIPRLVHHFCRQLNQRYNRHIEGCDAETMEILTTCLWPGNVRQLQHALEHAFVLTDPDETILSARTLPQELKGSGGNSPPSPSAPQNPQQEARQVLAALEAVGGNKTRAAKRLGITRAGLYKKIKRLGLDV